MFRTTKFVGIPMTTRRNRRVLVSITYLLLGIAVVALARVDRPFLSPGLWIVIAFAVVSRGIFGLLIPQESLPVVQKRAIESRLELAISGGHALPKPDERDVTVRNAAYFVAFRAVTMYAFWSWIIGGLLLEIANRPAPILQVVMIILVFTLPQAILLWNQPDLLEEEN